MDLTTNRNSEHRRPESKPLKTGSPDELKECLRLQMLKVGIRAANLPQAEEKAVLLNFITTKYGQWNIQQINEAFDLAIMGHLACDVNAFENFSCEYFARIMNAYKDHLVATGRLLSNHDKERTIGFAEPIAALPAPKRTPDEQVAASMELWLFMGKRIDFILPGTYEAIVEAKKVELTDDEKAVYMAAAKVARIQKERDGHDFFANLDKAIWQKEYAKKLVVHDYFTKQSTEKTTK